MKNYILIILTIVCLKTYGQTQADKDLNGVVYDVPFFSNISSDWRNTTPLAQVLCAAFAWVTCANPNNN